MVICQYFADFCGMTVYGLVFEYPIKYWIL